MRSMTYLLRLWLYTLQLEQLMLVRLDTFIQDGARFDISCSFWLYIC